MLNIEKKQEGTSLTVALQGRLDTTTSPELEASLKESLPGGLRVLLSAQKQMMKQGSMKLVHVAETVMEIFEVTGFVDILTIE